MEGISLKFEGNYMPLCNGGYDVPLVPRGTLYAIMDSTQEKIGSLSVYPFRSGVYLHSFGIWNENNRNKGIGRQMLRYIKEKCSEINIYLSCAHGNDMASHLYKSEGFEIVEDGDWYEMIYVNR
jgi:GNAT superfamily N-acetyltransferase